MVDATNPLGPNHPDSSAAAVPRTPTGSVREESSTSPVGTHVVSDRAPSEASERRGYRPLSIVAIAGLCLVGLYIAIIVGGAIAAISNSTPFLMPLWTLIIPTVGGLLSAVALLQINRSEGTLAGRNVAIWGLTLSVLFGLSYCAYVAAIFFAVQEQAKSFAQSFIEKLQKGETNSAFQFVLDPDRRLPENADFRQQLEVLYNGSSERSLSGALSQFEQNDLVRLLQRSGSELQSDFLGVAEWDYSQRGYLVKLNYRFTAPEGAFDGLLTVHSLGGRRSEVKGAQWFVVWDQCGLRQQHRFTSRGQIIARLIDQASSRSQSWCERLDVGNPEQVYLETRDPSERSSLQDRYRWQLLLHSFTYPLLTLNAGILPAALHSISIPNAEEARAMFLPGYREFRAGELVHADENFWTPNPALKAPMLAMVKNLFRYHPAAAGLPQSFEVEKTLFRPWKKVGDHFQVFSTCRISMPGPKFYVEAVVVAECDAKAIETGPPTVWRICEVNLKRGRVVASTPPAQQR